MKLKKNDEQWSWVNFKYEGAPTFCFLCGLIGHSDKFCKQLFETPEELITKSFGPWMRAEPRRKNHTIGTKWLRSGSGFPAVKSGEKEESGNGKVVTENNATENQLGGKEGMMIDSSKGNKGISQGGIKGNSLGNNIVEISQHNIIHNNNIITEKINEKINYEVDETELNIVYPKRRRMHEYFIHDTETNEEQ